MPKRGENIRKRKDGRWEARYKIGINASQKITYGSVYAKTYREAKEKQAEKQNEILRTFPGNRKNYSFNEVADLWLENNRLRIKGSTVNRYQNLLITHIIPFIGNRRIDTITGTESNAFLADKLKSGRVDGKGGLAPSYVRSIMLVINSVISYAVENRMRKPLDTRICKPQAVKHELPILTRLEQEKLVSLCCQQLDFTSIGVLLSLYAGLRIGEICALEWTDIDFCNRVIHVRKTIARIHAPGSRKGSVLAIEPPKTAASHRVIPLCSWLIPLLNQVKNKSVSNFVVSTTLQFVSPRTYDYRYHRLLMLAEIPRINYHALRHTFATRCIEAGMDVKSLSEMLGHANAAVTLNIYVHSSMDMKRNHIEKLTL